MSTSETESDGVERVREWEVDTDMSHDQALDTISDEMEDQVEMEKIKRATVEEGLLRLPVKRVVTSGNNEKWAMDVEHPTFREDEQIRFHLQKPKTGWTREHELVRVLNWYGITNQNPHMLQTKRVYVRHNPDSDSINDWELVEPPDYDAPIPVQLKQRWESTLEVVSVTDTFRVWLILTMLFATPLGMVGADLIGYDGSVTVAFAIQLFVFYIGAFLGSITVGD